MARLVAEGAAEAGAEAVVKTVAEPIPEEIIASGDAMRRAKHEKEDVSVAAREELIDHDGVIVGTPTRFGNMAAQMRNFWDQTGSLWIEGKLTGKPVGCFCSRASMRGGQEPTLVWMMMASFHHGMIVVGLPYSIAEMTETETGGTPYGASHGASHVAGHPPSVEISKEEAVICRALGKRVAEVAAKLSS